MLGPFFTSAQKGSAKTEPEKTTAVVTCSVTDQLRVAGSHSLDLHMSKSEALAEDLLCAHMCKHPPPHRVYNLGGKSSDGVQGKREGIKNNTSHS